jgi:hypothetical protein
MSRRWFTALISLGWCVGAQPHTPLWRSIKRILRFTGVTINPPVSFRGSSSESIKTGEIWVTDMQHDPRKISQSGNYRSPVFEHSGQTVLALTGSTIVRISLSDGSVEKLCAQARVEKLLGTSTGGDPVLMIKVDNEYSVVTLSLRSLGLTPIPYDKQSPDDRNTIEELRQWDRHYGNIRVFPDGTPANVFVQHDEGSKRNVSHCQGDSCEQPSMSHDRRLVVFVKAQN